jgi:N-acetylmuramoyl-L-alanine amidase
MKSLLLVIPGHLGKDVGATATLDSDGDGTPSFLGKLQEERWINLQQAIGFCVAHSSSVIRDLLDVRLVLPKSVGFFKGGPVGVLEHRGETLTLQDRVDLINGMDADAIEIHNNAAPFSASGFESLCFCRENKIGSLSESYQIASVINNSVMRGMGAKIRGVKPIFDHSRNVYVDREIFILKSVKNNCVITEGGFLSSPSDLANIDVDLDGYNEMMGASIFMGYAEIFSRLTAAS